MSSLAAMEMDGLCRVGYVRVAYVGDDGVVQRIDFDGGWNGRGWNGIGEFVDAAPEARKISVKIRVRIIKMEGQPGQPSQLVAPEDIPWVLTEVQRAAQAL
jgi:hypothetical protein